MTERSLFLGLAGALVGLLVFAIVVIALCVRAVRASEDHRDDLCTVLMADPNAQLNYLPDFEDPADAEAAFREAIERCK